ncbi:aminotransferase class I/II-fold pyridoxal phosphate-dependent enzyme [Urechidicola vernalis]|uniref:Pyridoxal phosphate-dependent aminotransferase family protein n=1 Tax=Urechidicola vernalis TaxID=3075600 RepID=A0ABU2Y7S7_9FLAO|nr:pyridoxal phosphate-dependent aminotransferase family protein [Urechidicola sp. P050]MDT0554253.1 pyridoxal phosphate-dependent aminotransferase family protein [Urechidicola sp. P050]
MKTQNDLIDFSSNDYLGFAQSNELHKNAIQILNEKQHKNGTTGSRLLSGNNSLHEEVEQQLATFFNAESGLLFNSGYDANVGLFSSVLQRGDLIFYDELIHASIRDGIQMSNAKASKFGHNDLIDLEKKLSVRAESRTQENEIYIVTESVFSMDGDSPDLKGISELCEKYNAHLIVDEAHATGVFGKNGEGLLQQYDLEHNVFARIHTFGKAIGCHGAVVLGSNELKNYLINFARSFIYTTAIPLHTVASIKVAIEELVILGNAEESPLLKLRTNINYFNQQLKDTNHKLNFVDSTSAIHCCVISGNAKVKTIASQVQDKGYDVKPILSPTVPLGEERLRICLHSYNSIQEIDEILNLLGTFAG